MVCGATVVVAKPKSVWSSVISLSMPGWWMVMDGKGAGNGILVPSEYFFENMRNVNRMLKAMDPDSSQRLLDLSDHNVRNYLFSPNTRISILRDSILPAPEIYHLACAFRALESRYDGCGPAGFLARFTITAEGGIRAASSSENSASSSSVDGGDAVGLYLFRSVTRRSTSSKA